MEATDVHCSQATGFVRHSPVSSRRDGAFSPSVAAECDGTGRKEFRVGMEGIFGKVALTQSDESVDSITVELCLRSFL